MALDLTTDDRAAVRAFFAARGLQNLSPIPRERLHEVMRAFEPVLYENLSKIRRRAACPRLDPTCLETPSVLLHDHLANGTGGTCYSLAYSLAALFEFADIHCYLTLNDIRGHRANHAAVVAEVDGTRWLCDPGVQFRVPAMFSAEGPTTADNGYCLVHVIPGESPADFNVKIQLAGYGATIPSFLFHSQPVDESTFREVWLQSFTGPMMNTFHIFRHGNTQSLHLVYGFRQDKIPGRPEMKEPVTLETLPRHVREIWSEIPDGHMEAAWQALAARGASPVMRYEDSMRLCGLLV